MDASNLFHRSAFLRSLKGVEYSTFQQTFDIHLGPFYLCLGIALSAAYVQGL